MKKPVVATLLALTAAAAAPSAAPAFKVGDGATVVSLDRAAAKALKSLGVAVGATGNAEADRKGIAFPVTGGKLDRRCAGVVRHGGGLKLSDGRRAVTLSSLRVVLEDHPFVQARVGDAKLKAFTLDVDDAEVVDDVTGSIITGVELDLSKQGAKALNGALRTSAFETGTKLGEVLLTASARAVRFTGGQTDLALDKGARDALTALGVTATPAEGTVGNADGSLGFPISGGVLTSQRGSITHTGGIVLTKGQTRVALTDFVIRIGKTARLLARVNGSAKRVAISNLDDNDADTSATDDTLTIEDVAAGLTRTAADALNQAFGTSAFQAGLTLGMTTVRGKATS